MTHVTLIDGTEIDLDRPDFTGVTLESIGIMLYRQLRYNGATRRPYCVLEHTIRGVRACLDPKQSPGLGVYGASIGRYFFLHDLHEIVTGDISAPVAAHIGSKQLTALKDRLDLAICRALGIDGPMTRHMINGVKAVDQVMFQREWIDLMPKGWDRAAPGGCHDGPVRDFMAEHRIVPEPIGFDARRSPQDMVGEFCHLWRVVR